MSDNKPSTPQEKAYGEGYKHASETSLPGQVIDGVAKSLEGIIPGPDSPTDKSYHAGESQYYKDEASGKVKEKE